VSRQFEQAMCDEYDIILTMTNNHKNIVNNGKAYTLMEYVGLSGDVSDPYGATCDVYQACAAEIRNAIELLYEKLRNQQ
jgi:protein-tyrosine-phosphatase